ncbi:hypothetical protein [Frankia nepalensis]|uniref:Uncharacterized protein n=1 Tax=Frankia nepalensis TaxID=1836974 RepID=A0A937UQJ9_9ACTN|nr:hypothetical protein [Frankia nepalensis]MBL7626776.1 hypothetical protein [Frankia nepalensis]
MAGGAAGRVVGGAAGRVVAGTGTVVEGSAATAAALAVMGGGVDGVSMAVEAEAVALTVAASFSLSGLGSISPRTSKKRNSPPTTAPVIFAIRRQFGRG